MVGVKGKTNPPDCTIGSNISPSLIEPGRLNLTRQSLSRPATLAVWKVFSEGSELGPFRNSRPNPASLTMSVKAD